MSNIFYMSFHTKSKIDEVLFLCLLLGAGYAALYP